MIITTTTTKASSSFSSPQQLPSVLFPKQQVYIQNAIARTRRRKISTTAATPSSTPTIQDPLQQQRRQKKIIISGAGPAGLATALALRKIGCTDVTVHERSLALPSSGAALGLWTNAWKALDALGVGNDLRSLHPPIHDVVLCREDGRVLRQFSLRDCSGGPHEFRGVRRASLVVALAKELPEESIVLGSSVVGIDPHTNAVLVDNNGLHRSVNDVDVVIGCDGAKSAVAKSLNRPPPNLAGQVAIRGVARLDAIRKTSTQQPQQQQSQWSCIRQVWGGNGPRAGMYPLSDTELYWFVCFDDTNDGKEDNNTNNKKENIRREALGIVRGWSWSLEDIIHATPDEDLFRSRIVDKWWFMGDNGVPGGGGPASTLVGDALHPMTPNLGQGGCTALEDAVVLAQLMLEKKVVNGGGDVNEIRAVFKEYEKKRTQRCLPLTIRSNLMGRALQLPWWPVTTARDVFVSKFFDASHFLDHATFDCGELLL